MTIENIKKRIKSVEKDSFDYFLTEKVGSKNRVT